MKIVNNTFAKIHLIVLDVPVLWKKLRSKDEALATTEWALLVAGVAALAIAVVAIVRTQTSNATGKISTNVNTTPTL